MTKAENKAAAKAWHEERERKRSAAARADAIKADLIELARLRHYLIFNRKAGGFAEPLIAAIDDYVGQLTGDRTALHTQNHRIG
jgi:hypothetical protein